jgi:cell wall-associated NlpC family hydrolase
MSVWDEIEIRTRTVTHTSTDPETGETTTEEEEEEYEWHILNIKVTNQGLDMIAGNELNESQLSLYRIYQSSLGNRSDLFGDRITAGNPASGGMSYDIPSEALSDAKFAAMITEAEKYLGYPYVWGGSSPSTSFDCSGFVSWVINNCGNGWNYGRQTANGLRSICTYVSPSEAKPGDLIFFEKTYNTTGASHVGIYVGNGMMIHCGNPIQYTSIETSYWQQHFLCFGRLP